MTLINTKKSNELIAQDKWASSHGVIEEKGYLGTSLLYFTLCYMLPAKVAVVIGSGSGYVPRLVRQAQREVQDEAFQKISRCILIDADSNDKGFGSPDYHDDPAHFFRTAYPEIEIWKMTSDQAFDRLEEEGVRIDFLHIDGDHTYAQSFMDFEQYIKCMSEDFIITMHDTALFAADMQDGCVPRTIAHLRNEMQVGGKYEYLEMINFNDRHHKRNNHFKDEMICCGTAVIKPKVLSRWDTQRTNAVIGSISIQSLLGSGN